jgi:non-homologous end joining protein Ku
MSLIEKMSSVDFEPERYADEYRERALAMIEKKVKGQEIKAVAPAHRPSCRYLRGVKEESGNRRPAENPNRRAR